MRIMMKTNQTRRWSVELTTVGDALSLLRSSRPCRGFMVRRPGSVDLLVVLNDGRDDPGWVVLRPTEEQALLVRDLGEGSLRLAIEVVASTSDPDSLRSAIRSLPEDGVKYHAAVVFDCPGSHSCPECRGPSQSPVRVKSGSLERRTWAEFRRAGLLWWVNRGLHLFGWAIVVEANEEGEETRCYPAHTQFRGFTPDCEVDGFRKLTRHMAEGRDRLARALRKNG